MTTIDIILMVAVIALGVMQIVNKKQSIARDKRLLEVMKKYRELADEIMKQLEDVKKDAFCGYENSTGLIDEVKEINRVVRVHVRMLNVLFHRDRDLLDALANYEDTHKADFEQINSIATRFNAQEAVWTDSNEGG